MQQDFTAIMKQYHAGQVRNAGRIPYCEHPLNVASILTSVIAITHETDDAALLADMHDAALGHDLLEDTKITEAEVLSATNQRTLNLIKELTNPVDDAHTERYMVQLKAASEEARLIKYADLVENTTSVVYGLPDLGLDWAKHFYRPILLKTDAVLAQTQFVMYPQAATIFRNMLLIMKNLLLVILDDSSLEESV